MYRVKLIKGRSYTGAIRATQDEPFVDVEDKAIAEAAVATGYFELIDAEGGDDNGVTDISKMTVPQLEQYAKDNNIDLGGATRKADIIKAIEAAQSEGGDDNGDDNNGSADFGEDDE